MPTITIYLRQDEKDFVKSRGEGYVRHLILEAMSPIAFAVGLNKIAKKEVAEGSAENRCKECGSLLIARAKKCLVCGAKQ